MKTARNGMIVSGGIFIIAMVFILMGFTGCAKFMNEHEFTMQLSVEAATARVLHEHPTWVKQTIAIMDGAVAVIDAKTVMDLQSAEAYIKGRINWGKMMPEEQALVSALISEVRRNIEDSLRAKDIVSPELQLVEVRQVLMWINQTAKRRVTP
jgi:hypothetical protein